MLWLPRATLAVSGGTQSANLRLPGELARTSENWSIEFWFLLLINRLSGLESVSTKEEACNGEDQKPGPNAMRR